MWTYISIKNDIREEINSPLTDMAINFDFNLLFFWENKNWKIAKNKDNQSDKFPKVGMIIFIIVYSINK